MSMEEWADGISEGFRAPVGDIIHMLENFEAHCKAGNWMDALRAIQAAGKWSTGISKDLLDFIGSREDARNPRLAIRRGSKFSRWRQS